MKAELILIGHELLNGFIQDTNGHWLGQFLHDRGITLNEIHVVPDDEKSVSRAIRSALFNSPLVFISGGLGPTRDDMTKNILAEFFSRPLRKSEEAREVVIKNYEAREKVWDEGNSHYHFVPEGFTPIRNPQGMAPGLIFYDDDRHKVVLAAPGVPIEFESMVEEEFLPYLKDKGMIPRISEIRHLIRTRNISEKAIFDKLCPDLYHDLSKFGHVCSLPRDFGIDILITLAAKDKKYISQIDNLVLSGPLQEFIWQIGEDDLPKYVLKKAIEKGITFGTAESCTGGLVASILTDVPGSSQAFQGGVVTYSNQTKIDLLGVSEETLKANGAVSEDTAKEMAIGALKTLKADIAVALTGISGPDGGTEEKPVGTVCIGLAKGDRAIGRRYHVRGDRRKIKNKFAHLALFQILEELL